MTDQYTVHGHCTNCGETGIKLIDRGTPVHETECSNCGCKMVRPWRDVQRNKWGTSQNDLGKLVSS